MSYPYQDLVMEVQSVEWTSDDGVEKSITLTGGHLRVPIVTVTQENSSTNENFFVESVTRTTATIGCSSLFNGIVHIQAISTK